MTISRVTFNYVVIGFVALFVGIVMGYFGYERVVNSRGSAISDVSLQSAVADALTAALAGMPTNLDGSPNPNYVYNVSDEGDPYLGAEDAVITMIEFGDFRCGYCKRFQDETIASLMEQFDGRVRLVFRDYPLLGQSSLDAALAAECADDQGKFWEFHDMLYTAPDQLTRDMFITHATDLALDVETFTTCYDTQAHLDEVVQDYQDGQALGVSGTPTFFINGKIFVGAQPLDSFIQRIDAELATLDLETAEQVS